MTGDPFFEASFGLAATFGFVASLGLAATLAFEAAVVPVIDYENQI